MTIQVASQWFALMLGIVLAAILITAVVILLASGLNRRSRQNPPEPAVTQRYIRELNELSNLNIRYGQLTEEQKKLLSELKEKAEQLLGEK